MKRHTQPVASVFLALIVLATAPAFSAISFFAKTSSPADNGTLTDAAAQSVTPPAGMHAGDFVYLIAVVRSPTATLSLADIAGQSWTLKSQQTVNGQARVRAFTTRFNGTWSANPAVETDEKSGVALTLAMLVFRPTNGANTWVVDAPQATAFFSAPVSPFDVTVTGPTANAASTFTVAAFVTPDDNSWGIQTSGWLSPGGTTQFRNASGNDTSVSIAYKIKTAAGATGSVTNRQTENGGDAGRWVTETFAEIPGVVAKKWHPGYYMLTPAVSSYNSTHITQLQQSPNIVGVQHRLYWITLEPTQGNYDFSQIDSLLALAQSVGKRVAIQINDRKFNSTDFSDALPPYLDAMGCVWAGLATNGTNRSLVKLWQQDCMDRRIALEQAMASHIAGSFTFDNHPYFEASVMEETSLGAPASSGYTHGAWVTQLSRLAETYGSSWPHTNTEIFTNFLGSNANMETVFQAMADNDVGSGGPDTLPPPHARPQGAKVLTGEIGGHDYRGELMVGYALQSPELGGKEDTGCPSDCWTMTDFYNEIKPVSAGGVLGVTHWYAIRKTGVTNGSFDWTTIKAFIDAGGHPLTTACPTTYVGGCDTN